MRFLAGKGKAVAPDPIQLTVYSPVVPNLTLVDMPGAYQLCAAACCLNGEVGEQVAAGAGLTKVPIDGQPRSIVKDLEDMARTYIKVRSHAAPGLHTLRSGHCACTSRCV